MEHPHFLQVGVILTVLCAATLISMRILMVFIGKKHNIGAKFVEYNFLGP